MAEEDRGFKIASAYVEVGLNEDQLDRDIAGLDAKLAGIRARAVSLGLDPAEVDKTIAEIEAKLEGLRGQAIGGVAINQAGLDEAIAEIKAKLAALGADHVEIRVGAAGVPETTGDMAGLAAVMKAIEENSARLAEAITGLNSPIRETGDSTRSLGAGAQSAIERLIGLAGASANAADAAKYAYAATQLAGIGAKGMGDQSGSAAPKVTALGNAARSAGGMWGMLTKEVTLFGGALGNMHMVGQIPLWHVLLDGILETTIGLTEASIAVGVFAAVAAPAAEDIYTHVKSVDDVVHALGVNIPPVTGHFREMAQAMAPQVVELYGAALNTMSGNGTALARVVSELTTGFDNWGARLDLYMGKQQHQAGIVQAGTDVLRQMSVVLDNLGVAFGNLMKADPGTVHFLLDVVEGASRLIEILTKIPTPILYTTLAIHSFMMWGGLLTTGITKLLSPLGSLYTAFLKMSDVTGLADRFGILGTQVGKLKKSTDEAGESGEKTGTIFSLLNKAGVWGWAGVGVAALGGLVYWMTTADSATKGFIANLDNGLGNMKASQAIVQISTDVGQLDKQITMVGPHVQQLNESTSHLITVAGKNLEAAMNTGPTAAGWAHLSEVVASGSKAMISWFGLVHASMDKASDIDAYKGAIVSLSKEQASLFGETGKLIQQGYTYNQSLALMDLAGVKAGDSLALMGQKVSNLVTGYQNMSVRGPMLANSVDAVTFAAEQQDSKIQQLTQGWSAYIGMVTGGESAFATFEEQVQGLAQVSSGVDPTTLAVSGGKVSVATKAAAGGLNATAMSATSANSAVSSYARSLVQATSAAGRMTAAEQKLTTVLQSSGMSASAARGDVDAYSNAVLKNGVNSSQAASARSRLLADLEHAGMSASSAASAISTLTSAVLTDSKNGQLTQAARQKLITDLEHAGLSAAAAKKAVDAYTTAVDKNGMNSKQAQAARAQLLKDLQATGTAGKQAGSAIAGGAAVGKASLDGLNAASLQLKSTWQTAITDGNQLMNALLMQASAAGLGAKGTRLMVEAGKDVVAQLLPMAKGSKAATAELYALAQEAGYRGPDSFRSLTEWVGKTKDAEKDLETVTGKLTAASANLASDVQNLANAVNSDLNTAMAAAIVQAGGGQKAFDQFATAAVRSHDNVSAMSDSASALAQVLIQTIGNTGQAEATFDAFAQSLHLTHQQAETLWLSVTGGARALSAADPTVRKFADDIMAAGGNSKTTAGDIETLAQAVADHGQKSQAAQGARAQLIKDLENAKVSAKDATTMVDGLTTSLGKIPHSELIKILMTGSGTYTIKQLTGQGLGVQGPPPGVAAAADGMLVRGGIPGVDSVPILAMEGEAVVPRHLVPPIAPYLKAHGVRGFADGGLVTSGNTDVLSGAYGVKMDSTFRTDMEQAMVAAMKGALKQAASAAASAGAGPGGGTAAQNEALAKSMFPWAASQWQPFYNVEMAEAGFNQYARNPSSGAYGMPQALPYTKMPKAAWPASAGGSSNPRAQLGWMFQYIQGRYGTPAAAWAHEQAYRWYGTGGHMRPGEIGVVGDSGLEVIQAGQQGATVTPAGGAAVHAEFNYYGTQHPTPEMRQAMVMDLTRAVGAAG